MRRGGLDDARSAFRAELARQICSWLAGFDVPSAPSPSRLVTPERASQLSRPPAGQCPTRRRSASVPAGALQLGVDEQ